MATPIEIYGIAGTRLHDGDVDEGFGSASMIDRGKDEEDMDTGTYAINQYSIYDKRQCPVMQPRTGA